MGGNDEQETSDKFYREIRKKYLKEKRRVKFAIMNEKSTLLPSGGGNGSVPRVDKLQSLEAKMASIEVSLGWRRRREALLETLPRAARELVRELDALHQTVREKENCIQGLRTQITNLGGTVAGGNDGGGGGVITESEKKTIQERLSKVESEIDAKKVAVKNLKLTLDKIDITDNIDVRIRAAELEYELEREELNILNLKEEASVLTTRLQESCLTTPFPGGTLHAQQKARLSFQDLLAVPGNSTIVSGISLVSASVTHTPGNPPFHVTCRPPYGCVIDWATDDTRLKKGDRIIEINHENVLGKNIEDVTQLMSSSANLSLVIARPNDLSNGIKKLEKQLEEKIKENKEISTRLEKALKEKDSTKNDNTRLSHRISYLEDQVNEMQSSMEKMKNSVAITNGDQNDAPTPSQPGATIIQVFQKGHQTLAVAGPEIENSEGRVQEYPTLPRIKSPSSLSQDSGSFSRVDEKEDESNSTKSNEDKHSHSSCESGDFITYKSYTPSPKHIPSENSSRLRPSKDEYSDYQSVHIKCKPNVNEETYYRSKREDYDCIEKLRDKLTEKTPSYSYTTPVIGPSDQQASKKGDHWYRPKKPNKEFYQSCPDNIDSCSNKTPTSRHSRDSKNNEGKLEYSRPSSREDLVSPQEVQNGHSKTSRSMNFYEKPPRRVVSPGAEDIRPVRPRPIPPKKPERLSLQRTTSMQSVEEARSCSRASLLSTSSKTPSSKFIFPSAESGSINGSLSSHYEDVNVSLLREGSDASSNVSFRSEGKMHENINSSPSSDNSCNSNGKGHSINGYEDVGFSYRFDDNEKSSPKVTCKPEDRYPIPSPRSFPQNSHNYKTNNTIESLNNRNNETNIHKSSKKGHIHNYRESRRLTVSSIDSLSGYESPYGKHSPYVTNGHQSYIGSLSPDTSLHLDTSLGLDVHEDVRAQPLYEYIHHSTNSSMSSNGRSKKNYGLQNGKEREGFEAPPTPSTPPRGINLSMKNFGRKGEEWC